MSEHSLRGVIQMMREIDKEHKPIKGLLHLHLIKLFPFMKKYNLLLHPLHINILHRVFVLELTRVLHKKVGVVTVDFSEAEKVDFFVDFVEGEIVLWVFV